MGGSRVVQVHPSALKHGIDEESSRSAASRPIYVSFLDEDSPARQPRLGFDDAGRLLELIVLKFDSGREIVIHSMKARQQYLDLLN
jgi:hypothetical protein